MEVQGLLYPFEMSGTGTFKFGGGKEIVDSDIKTSVIVPYGERPMYKALGSFIESSLFSNFVEGDVATETAIKDIIKTAINEHTEYGEVENLDDIKISKVDKLGKKGLLIHIKYVSNISGNTEETEFIL